MNEKIIEKIKIISKNFPEFEEELNEICEEIKNFYLRVEEIENWKDRLEKKLKVIGLMWKTPEYFEYIEGIILGYDQALKGDYSAVAITGTPQDAEAIENAKGTTDIKGLAILSNHLSDVQFYKLLSLPKDIDFYVILDSDAHRDTVEIAKRLYNSGREKTKVVLLEKGSPASISEEKLVEALNSAKVYSFDLELGY